MIHILDASGRFAAPEGELSIAFLAEKEMGELHGRFLDDPSPTDVITFDGDGESDSAGEICVCADVALNYAAEHGLNFAEELSLYIMHGYLHLCGFDDVDPVKKRRMRLAEKRAMSAVREAGALPGFQLRNR